MLAEGIERKNNPSQRNYLPNMVTLFFDNAYEIPKKRDLRDAILQYLIITHPLPKE
jgi:hypothetical protein